jgi:hypothetical protein
MLNALPTPASSTITKKTYNTVLFIPKKQAQSVEYHDYLPGLDALKSRVTIILIIRNCGECELVLLCVSY